MNTIKQLILAGILFGVASLAYADITGSYSCQGVDPFNSNNQYTYPLTVTASGKTFTFQYMNDKGYPTVYGTGIIDSSIPDMVAVIYSDNSDKTNYGVKVFQVQSDGSLQGSWTKQSEQQVGTENCTKSKS